MSGNKRRADRDDAETNEKRPRNLYTESEISLQEKRSSSIPSEVLEGLILEEEEEFFQVWDRPECKWKAADGDSLVFQQMDVDYTMGQPIDGMPGSRVGPVPIVRMFGVTREGNSVLAYVHGFLPYFYVPAPPGFTDAHLEPFRLALGQVLRESQKGQQSYVEPVLLVERKFMQSIMGYRPKSEKVPFLHIIVASPKLVPPSRNILEDGNFSFGSFGPRAYQTYESNIQFALRFMIDCDIMGASWLEVKSEDVTLVPESKKTSHCQVEFHASFEKVVSLGCEGEWSSIAPLRVLSFDIECANRKGFFPDPDKDAIIQIANVVSVQGCKQPFIRNVFTLRTCSSIVGAEVFCFEHEKDLLKAWRDMIIQVDPDIITGYNINSFDLWYIVKRAEALKQPMALYLSRTKNELSKIKDAVFSSRAWGRRESKETNLSGRVVLDMMQAIQRDHKLRSYSLNAVSAHFLGQQKEDVHHSIITDLFNGSDEDRHRLAVYCLKDALLPMRLMEKLMIMINYIEMARVTGVPLSYLLSRGQQVKVISQLYRRCISEDLVIPAMKSKGQGDEVAYTGATVIQPISGFYEVPIATLDFASLYPSIMMAHNLCYTSLLEPSAALKMDPKHVTKTPSGDFFARRELRPGLLPLILEDLLAARKKAKRELAAETDPFKKAVLDGRQLALKISANSVYGFTGATVGKLPCLAISRSTTAFGREMIEHTKRMVESKYTVANGYAHDALVVYGDTDSVMVKFGVDTVAEAMDMGREAAEHVTTTFIRPISLEFEKVYFPYLLMSKKRYAGLYWTKPDAFDKLDAKGIVTVRRDNCQLVKTVIDTCLRKILIDKDVVGAQDYAKGVISDLLQNKVDISLLVISKSFAKKEEDYAAKQAHVELAARMRARDPGTAPNIGERIPYVWVTGAKDAKAYEKAEDPLYALENSIPIDTQYYLQHQIANPLMDIFSPIMTNPRTLLSGSHTKKIAVKTPATLGIGRFAVVRPRCLGCNAILPKGYETLCKHCQTREGEIYSDMVSKVKGLEQKFSRLWTQCQDCQGSLHQTVLCTSRDCPIFYMRTKMQKDLTETHKHMQRFSLNDW